MVPTWDRPKEFWKSRQNPQHDQLYIHDLQSLILGNLENEEAEKLGGKKKTGQILMTYSKYTAKYTAPK